jgi:hypothetical protein
MEDDTARQIVQEMEATSDRYRILIAHLRGQIIAWKNIAGGLAECLVEQMDDPRSDNEFHIKQIHDYARALKFDGGEFDSALALGEFLNKMEL